MRGIWWRIALRNLGRNPKRTTLAAGALAFGFAAAVVMVALSDGMTAELIDNGTRSLAGQIQIHAKDYLPARHTWATVGADSGVDLARLLARVDSEPGVTAAAPRVYGGGLISAGDHTVAGLLLGVDPAREPGVSDLLKSITQGAPPRAGTHDIAIGTETARRLHAQVGDTIVLVAPAADGSMGNDLYEVRGIYHTGLDALDAGMGVLPIDALQSLLALAPNRVHEIAIAVSDPWSAAPIAERLAAMPTLAGLHATVEPWNTFRPELAQYANLAKSTNGFFIAIVFLMAIFGVTNTLLMSTFERRREFAVEQALGVDARVLARTVVYEGIVLGVLSLVAGALIAAPIVYWWHVAPLDLSRFVGDMTMTGALVHPVFRADPSIGTPLISAVALLVTSILAALYPAWRATRVPPADALGGRE
jgi:ABC-type lipoprotein release transport system permease subunit